jgi:hypothetical protein
MDVLGSPWSLPAEGFEPPTYGLQNRCTTTVLSRRRVVYYNRRTLSGELPMLVALPTLPEPWSPAPTRRE